MTGYRPMTTLFNADDHLDFDRPEDNFEAAPSERASWGYFDPGAGDYHDGCQSPPVAGVQLAPQAGRLRQGPGIAGD